MGQAKARPLYSMNQNNLSKLNQFLEEIALFPDREGKIEYLLEVGRRFKEVPKEIASRPFDKSHQVPACESDAYAWAVKNPDNTFKLYFAVENPQGISAKALAVILDEGLSGCTKEVIQSANDDIVNKIFGDSISMGKGEGLRGMIRVIRHLVASN